MEKHEESKKTTTESEVTNSDKDRVKRWVATAALLVAAVVAGYFGSWIESSNNQASFFSDATSILKPAENDGNTVVTANEEAISSVAKTVSPSVVSITSTSSSSSSVYGLSSRTQAAGTGMIVSSSGYIMTNKHVVDSASRFTVIAADGKSYKNVEKVGVDPLNDIAFLKISGVKDLPTVTLGDSKTVRIGQTVVAIGNALGQYQNSVTSGIISGTGRPVVASNDGTQAGAESLSDLLQTDAAINSGNSGGPLLNIKGQVIGINTAIAADAQGVGFAIPIGAAKGMLAELLETGTLKRPYLGVRYVSITPESKSEYKLPVNSGDYVIADSGKSVQEDGPAAKAGIKNKDIIIKINGVEVGKTGSVSSLISEYRPGETVEVTVLRDGSTKKINVKLGAYSD